jgi:hypothetical protein
MAMQEIFNETGHFAEGSVWCGGREKPDSSARIPRCDMAKFRGRLDIDQELRHRGGSNLRSRASISHLRTNRGNHDQSLGVVALSAISSLLSAVVPEHEVRGDMACRRRPEVHAADASVARRAQRAGFHVKHAGPTAARLRDVGSSGPQLAARKAGIDSKFQRS